MTIAEAKVLFCTTCIVHLKSCDSLDFCVKKARRRNLQKPAREQEMLKNSRRHRESSQASPEARNVEKTQEGNFAEFTTASSEAGNVEKTQEVTPTKPSKASAEAGNAEKTQENTPSAC
jgi:hypothetical protein